MRRNSDVKQAEQLLEEFDSENILAQELLATLEDRKVLAKDEAKARRTVIERSLPALKTPPFDGNRENFYVFLGAISSDQYQGTFGRGFCKTKCFI